MLSISGFIQQQLPRVSYEYDPETKEWCAWISNLPGVYAQAKTVEAVRQQIIEMMEDYVLVALRSGTDKKIVRRLDRRYATA
jgi:predicted RNase H-like HicB family nuclease